MAATYSSLVGLAVGGKYEVRRVLGIGGMGVVCEAIHVDLGKKVAIKLIDKTMKESELIVARFRREARALGQIQSEHIVDVFDVGADARVGLYMVMEHLPGEDLQTRLERDSRLDLTTGVMIAHQMARALEKAHAAGVIHRDLKPANVFLTFRDNGSMLVKLLDFGVSKVLNEVGGARITGSGAPIGTPLYMSPEQAEGRDDTDTRADIWSLGAVLYEALAGAPPFPDRGSYHGTIVGILTSRPKLLHDAAPWVPPDLGKVVDAMLVHDRAARIKDAATVIKRLLEAFPAVLPDGTGRHTAVIVPSTAAVDATGDTEIFSSLAFKDAQSREPSPRSDALDEDSRRTLPKASPGNEALRTAAATPVEVPGRASEPEAPDTPRTPTTGNKTDPLLPPWRSHAASSSAAGGVALPETPARLAPLASYDIAADTQRDTTLAVKADRKRKVTLGIVATLVACVALFGYLAGRRATPRLRPSAVDAVDAPLGPALVPSAATSTRAPAATASAGGATNDSTASSPKASAEPSPVASSSAAPVTSAAPTPDVHARPLRRVRTRTPPADLKSQEPKPAEETPSVPENPFQPAP